MYQKTHILLVDDEESILNALKRTLRRLTNVRISTACDGRRALALIKNDPVDIVITDLTMPEMDGHELCAQIAESYPDTLRIMLTAHADLDNILASINQGKVWSYLQKPWDNNGLLILLKQAIKTREMISERSLLREKLYRYEEVRKSGFGSFVGDSIAMQMVYAMIERSAASKASVFITGESGTGKEVAAQTLHSLSPRKDAPFVALNCAAIPSELMESEIFGHVKGAFSGAVSHRDGAATLAHGGTLFLDELGEMDISLQAKILRFIQTGEFQKVGSGKMESANIRFICATNRDPLEAIKEGRLREDLYYRLNVISIDLPALKDREEDVFQIAMKFLDCFSAEEGKEFIGFTNEAKLLLRNYSWPGNVRQLQNLIHSSVVMSQGPLLDLETLSEQLRLSDAEVAALINPISKNMDSHSTSSPSKDDDEPKDKSQTIVEPLAMLERRAIEQAVSHYNDNVVQAANALGISPSTLYRKIQIWQSN